MSTTLPEQADIWVEQWQSQLADRPAFAEAADGFTATFRFEITPDESYDGDPVVLRVVLDDGVCTVADVIDDPEYDFALRGPYTAWKALLRNEIEVSTAVMDGPFAVEGDTIALLQRQEAVVELALAARDVETTFSH